MKEQDLIALVIAGDGSARDSFYDEYHKLIWHVINAIGLKEHESEELFQEVFVRLFKDDCACLRQWRGDSSPALALRQQTVSQWFSELERRCWQIPDAQ